MSRLKKVNGFLCLDGYKYSELNWFGQYLYSMELQILKKAEMFVEKKTIPLRMAKP